MKTRSTFGLAIGTVAALLATRPAVAQETKDAIRAAEAAPAPRLRLQFQETRQKDGATTAVRACTLTLHADGRPAEVFVGTQFSFSTPSEKGTPTVLFKNAGLEARVAAEALPDGGYQLQARYERTSIVPTPAGTPSGRERPILRAHVRAETVLRVREGETVPLVTSVDPATGELLRVTLSVAPSPAAKPARAAAAGARLLARFLLTRRQGERTLASRPYTVLLATGDQPANVFSGNQLPIATTYQGQATVMIKDVGTGARLTAQRLADGRYRLEVEFSDDVLSPAQGAPTLQSFHGRSTVVVREGETIPLASGADPESGEIIGVDVTVEPAE